MPIQTLDVLDRPEVGEILFHPRRNVFPPRDTADTRSLRIPVAPDVAIGGKVFIARPDAPVILFFHGNGEIASDYDDIARLYRRIGITLFVADYRGYGISEGDPTATTLVADARIIHDRSRDLLAGLGLTPPGLFVMGRSLGSASALEIATHAGSGIAGLIIESGFADTLALVRRLGGPPLAGADEARDGFGNLRKIAKVTVPTLIIHGTEDWIIPYADAEALHRHCGAAEKRLVTIAGAGHNDLLATGQRPYFEAIRDLVARHAAPAG